MLLTTITNGSACGMGIGSCGGNVDANRDHNIKWVIYANDCWYGNSCCFGKPSILIMLTAKTMMMVFYGSNADEHECGNQHRVLILKPLLLMLI